VRKAQLFLRQTRYIRFSGLENSAKQSVFQVVEFEAYGL